MNLWQIILRLFGVKQAASTDEKAERNARYARAYEDTSDINFTTIFASKLTTLAVSEASADVTGDNARSEFLNQCLCQLWDKLKRISMKMLGTGGCVIIPYVQNRMLQFDIISQDFMRINKKQGELITSATILADTVTENSKRYYRWINYNIENGTLYITNKVTNDSGNPAEVTQWAGIEDYSITGIDRVLFAFVKCPTDNRHTHDYYGVPVTFGCDSIIKDIKTCIGQIQDEFKLKEVKVFADERMFKKDPKTGEQQMPSKLYIASHGKENGSPIDVFSPEIRDSSYYERLTNLYELLEKSVGTSKGILTAPETRGATATEIKAGIYDTYAMVSDIRKELEKGIKEYIYCCDALANCFNLAPMGDYEITFDWSYSMIESSSETWAQLKDAQSMGVVGKAEVRQWLRPNETVEEAQKNVEEIQKNEPTLNSLLGGGMND